MISLADPTREHAHLAEVIEAAVLRTLRSGQYILGPTVETFEKEFAQYCGANHCVGVSNGSDAIVVALQALQVGPGDEVITTAFSYLATASAITRTGARPVFVDIDPVSFNLDPACVARALTPRTRAVLPVHLFGRPADVSQIRDVLGGRDVHIVEDAAQAVGAELRGQRTGQLGSVACFSFFPAKPFGTAGDGGACVTSDADLARRMKQVRVTGAVAKNVHDVVGGNYRLDPIHAAILSAKLPHLESRLARRRANAARLRDALQEFVDVLTVPAELADGRHVYAQFTVRHAARDRLAAALKSRGVAAEVYYPMPMPYQKVFASHGHVRGDFPNAERCAAEVLSIPVHSELTDDELSTVITAVKDALREMAPR